MKNIDIEIEYLQKLRDGATVPQLNKKLLMNGQPLLLIEKRPCFDVEGTFTWKPEEVTITIPKPMSVCPDEGQDYFYRSGQFVKGYNCDVWDPSLADIRRFERGIWATEEEMKQVIAADKAAVVAARGSE